MNEGKFYKKHIPAPLAYFFIILEVALILLIVNFMVQKMSKEITFQIISTTRLNSTIKYVNVNTNANTNTAANVNAADETAGWKTYTNNEFTYVVKYPNGWEAFFGSKSNEPRRLYLSFGDTDFTKPLNNNAQISILVSKNIGTVDSLQDFGGSSAVGPLISEKDFILNGHKALQKTYQGTNSLSFPDNKIQQLESHVYYFDDKYVVEARLYTGGDQSNSILESYQKILSAFQFLADTASEKTTDFWLSVTESGKSSPLLKSINVTTGKITEWRSYPGQGPNSDNIVTTPRGERMAYHRYSGSNLGIYLSSTKNDAETLVAPGFICLDGPCELETSVSVGSFSWDGKYLTYQKGSKSVVRNLETSKVTELQIRNESLDYHNDATFTPKDTYVYVPYRSSAGEQGIQLGKISDSSFRTIMLPLSSVWNVAFSPDEQSIASSGQNYNTQTKVSTTTLLLINVTDGKVMDQMIFSEDQTGTDNIVWLSNSRFIVVTGGSGSRNMYRIDVKDGQMSSQKIYQESGGLSYVQRVDYDTIFFESFEGNSFTLKSLDLGGESKTVYTANPGDTMILLGPKK